MRHENMRVQKALRKLSRQKIAALKRNGRIVILSKPESREQILSFNHERLIEMLRRSVDSPFFGALPREFNPLTISFDLARRQALTLYDKQVARNKRMGIIEEAGSSRE